MTNTVLTASEEKELMNWVNNIDIDVEELPSAHYDRNPYGLEEPLYYGSGCWEYDEDDYDKAQKEKAIEYLEADGIQGYFNWMPENENDDEEKFWEDKTKAAIEHLSK